MYYSAQILGKDVEALTLRDLENFFLDPRAENSILEFKSGKVKISSLYKEISAFLNTEGGLIIAGSPEEDKYSSGKSEKRRCQGKMIPTHFKDKEWLMSMISANITPPPENLKVKQFENGGGTIYVIDIPQSLNPPHQCIETGKYYIRVQDAARPAPHSVVEALFMKNKKPRLNLDLNLSRGNAETFNTVEVNIENLSDYPTDQLNYWLQVINVEDIEEVSIEPDNNYQKEMRNGTISIKGKSEMMIVQELKLKFQFVVNNKLQPYILSLMAWNKESGLIRAHRLFDPVNFSDIKTNHSGNGGSDNLEDMKKALAEILSEY